MNVRNSNKAIIIKNQKLLTVVKQDKDSEYYILPGGGHEFGETIHEGLKRECREETGLEIDIDELLYIRDYISSNHEFAYENENLQQVELMFSCQISDDKNIGKGTVPDDGQIGLKWLDINMLNEYRLYPVILRTLIPSIGKVKQSIYLGDVN